MKLFDPAKINQPLRLLLCFVLLALTSFFLIANGGPPSRPDLRHGVSYQGESDCSGEKQNAEILFSENDDCSDDECDPKENFLQELGIDDALIYVEGGLYNTHLEGTAGITSKPVRCSMIKYEDLNIYFFDCVDADTGEAVCTLTLR